MKEGRTLRKYTNLAACIHLLQTKQITLLTPASWDDRNDRHFMAEYKKRKGLKTFVAICFAKDVDTYHHWRVFSPNSDGVCIVFKKQSLLRPFTRLEGVFHRSVRYERIRDLAALSPKVKDLPFIKRDPYRAEGEYRITFEHRDHEVEAQGFPISLDCIEAIVLSPWMHISLVESVRKTLKAIDGCDQIAMYQSTLIQNEKWQAVTDQVDD